MELASQAERRNIDEKERKQRDFFRSMEANILKALDNGQAPGMPASGGEDVVKPLPKSALLLRKKPKKPTLFRTISSMDDELIAELAQDTEDRAMSKTGLVSPDSASTSFFDSLPQPGQQYPSRKLSPLPPTATIPLNRVITPPSSEVSKDLPRPMMGKRNTCGSLYISNTMADPDKDAAIKVSLGSL